MTDEESYAAFQQKVARHRHTLERYHVHLRAYIREHPDCTEDEALAYTNFLETAIPGLREAFVYRQGQYEIITALVSDCGDGLPVAGPSSAWDAEGERSWKTPVLWTIEDFRVTLAWYREPGAPAAQLAALIAYGEARWPAEDLTRQPWPDISDLPTWQDLTLVDPAAEDLDDDEQG